jgi:hypothetical protein
VTNPPLNMERTVNPLFRFYDPSYGETRAWNVESGSAMV